MNAVRSVCGRARVEYDPVWSSAKPWGTFANGTALNAFYSLSTAVTSLQHKGFRFLSVPSEADVEHRYALQGEAGLAEAGRSA